MTSFHRPDEAVFIRRYADLFERIPAFIALFARPHRERKHRVFSSWVKWQDDGAGEIAMDYGTQFFYERFVRALEDAQQGIEMVVHEYASAHKDHIEPIDEIGSCNDPAQLLSMYDGARFDSDYQVDDVGRFEIMRKLTIATQIMCIACADPYERVTNDLTTTNLLVANRLFARSKDELALGFVLNENANRRLHTDYELQLSRDLSTRFVWAPGLIGHQRRYVCRVIEDGDTVYLVKTDSRPKPRISGVIKLERGGKLTDRRGLKHIVIAVDTRGALRPARRTDVEQVAALARERLWLSPLREEVDQSSLNPYSSRDYWAAKIVGRLETNHGFPVAAPVEHQLTSVADDLNAEFATDTLGHKGYRQKVVREFILKQWFPVWAYAIDWSRET